MSLGRLLDREVDLVRRAVTGGRNAHGVAVTVDEVYLEGVRAMREITAAGEDVDQRDEQATEYRYLLEPRTPEGDPIEISGFDAIVDGLDLLEIIGQPEEARQRSRRRTHHLEVKARLVGPAPTPDEVGS